MDALSFTENPFADFDAQVDPLLNDLDLTMPEVPDSTPDELAAVKQLLNHIAAKSTTKRQRSAEGKSPMSEKISIRIPRPILAMIKESAQRRGMGYQVLVNELLREATTKH